MKQKHMTIGGVIAAYLTSLAMAGSYESYPPSQGSIDGSSSGNGGSRMGGVIGGSSQAAAMLSQSIEKIWSVPTLYSSGEGWLKKVKAIGRYQGQYADVDADQGDYSDWEHRRARLGFQIESNTGVKALAQWNVDVNGDSEDIVKSIEDLYVQFKALNGKFKIGKQKDIFHQEWNISSTKIMHMERSLMVNTVTGKKNGGILYSGQAEGGLSYKLGLFTGSSESDDSGWANDLPNLDGGLYYNASVGYNCEETGAYRLDFFHNDGDAGNNNTRSYENGVNLGYDGSFGTFNVLADLTYATGHDGSSDVYGIVINPYIDLSDSLSLAFRYQFMASDASNGLKAQKRYEQKAGSGKGDTYNSIGATLSYFINKHKLKLMGGLEYSVLDDDAYDGLTAWTGIRLYF